MLVNSTFNLLVGHTVISRNVVRKKVHATIPKGNLEYDQYTVSNDCSCRTYFGCFPLAPANTRPCMASRVILSNFFEEQWIQKHPQYLLGLPHSLFPTSFLEIAVYKRSPLTVVFSATFLTSFTNDSASSLESPKSVMADTLPNADRRSPVVYKNNKHHSLYLSLHGLVITFQLM